MNGATAHWWGCLSGCVGALSGTVVGRNHIDLTPPIGVDPFLFLLSIMRKCQFITEPQSLQEISFHM
ncbi:hypothetical protein EMIT0324P_11201 [Pseudomonas chlororaphis]